MATAQHARGIDHAVFAVRDLDRAEAQWQRLGFKLTPRGHHSRLGSANHCAMFAEGDYLELLALGPTPGQRPFYERFLSLREGIGGVAFKTADAARTFEALKSAGLRPEAPVSFGRPVAMGGTAKEAKFTTTEVDPALTPGARVFFCQHRTPELVWLPDYLDHANGARGIAGFTVMSEGPALAETYGRILEATPQREGAALVLRVGRHRIDFIDPAAARARYPGDPLLQFAPPLVASVRVDVAARAGTAKALQAAGIPHRTAADGAIVAASTVTAGTIIEFA